MNWRLTHRWLGLVAGALALVLGITGTVLSVDPVVSAWQAHPGPADLPVATLVERVARTVPGAEEIRRTPAGDILVFGFDAGQARAVQVDPADGRVIGEQPSSPVMRWFKNLHRSFLLGNTGRIAAAAVALAMLLLCISGLVMLQRRQGGWRKLLAAPRGSGLSRIHVIAGQAAVAVLCISALTGLFMSAVTFDLVTTDAEVDPVVASTVPVPAPGATLPRALAPSQLPLLQQLMLQDLRKLNVPAADDPQDTWRVSTAQGQGWIDRHTGRTLAWHDAGTAQRLHDWATLLHTGEGAWVWAPVVGLGGASVALFWVTGLMLWLQARRLVPRIADQSPVARAETLIFVASENGSTWGFAQALHAALVRAGHAVHTGALENFGAGPATRRVLVLAATYGDGQAPAHAAGALQRIAGVPVTDAPVAVLGFGDRQFPAYCAYAQAVDQALLAKGWKRLMPLERIHQQSAQDFARWGERLAAVLGEPLQIDYRPRLPATTALELVSRQDFAGGGGEPAVILRFVWPAQGWMDRMRGRGLHHFVAGDLIGILAPDTAAPRLYSLASGWRDGFVEICVRKMPGGVCSGYLHGLQPGDRVPAFIRPNPAFALDAAKAPVMLIGAGTGVAPLAGFIRDNTRQVPMHLYYGMRDPALDYYFGPEIEQWRRERRVASVSTIGSRTQDGGYVQDVLQRDAPRLRELLASGAIVRVCGSRPMAQAVAQVLDGVLRGMGLSVQQLKAHGRYAEDTF